MQSNCNDQINTNVVDSPIFLKKSKNYAMIDLHGCSLELAEKIVNHWLLVSSSLHYDQIRFVTGRGNHINSQGERGTLYKSFKSWIECSPHKNRIEKCEEHTGYFEILLKSTQPKSKLTNFFEVSLK